MTPDDTAPFHQNLEKGAGGGLVHRREVLMGSVLTAGALTVQPGAVFAGSVGEDQPRSMRVPGGPFRGYGQPSRFEQSVTRGIIKLYKDLAPGAGVSMTPLQDLNGTITPNGLHFNRSHNGVPDIDPKSHILLIHGLVERPLKFDVEAIMRYGSVSRICFIECSGNSFFNSNRFPEPMQVPVGMIHGLVSAAEWTGVPLATLLEEAGVKPKARWVLAEGADAAAMSRSIPIEKCLDDAIIALYQNGERIRPEQGYPMRLLLPGFEGNMSVKWLRRIKLTAKPTHTKDETSKYTDLLPNGKALQFTHKMDVKSVITHPATGLTMRGPGFYEISGLAWTGHGRIVRVEISADGGTSWADAAIGEPNLPHALVRFRLPWQWDGSPIILMSRATDEKGNVQPTREAWSPQYAAGQLYHCNAIQSWSIGANGEIKNVYV